MRAASFLIAAHRNNRNDRPKNFFLHNGRTAPPIDRYNRGRKEAVVVTIARAFCGDNRARFQAGGGCLATARFCLRLNIGPMS
jgi:hypothetical protein